MMNTNYYTQRGYKFWDEILELYNATEKNTDLIEALLDIVPYDEYFFDRISYGAFFDNEANKELIVYLDEYYENKKWEDYLR